MIDLTTWTGGEMMACAAAARISSTDVAVVGLGLPQVAALLAERTHAQGATLLLELGVFQPRPTEPAMGIADPRMWEGAPAFGSMLDVLGSMLHGGRVTLGILGALEVDPFGCLNTTAVRAPGGELRRFNGSGGGNDIASLADCTMVVMRHDERKFARSVEFRTSPGRRVHGQHRRELGLQGQGTCWVITDRACIEMTDDGPLLASVHPGESPDAVLSDTPVPLKMPPAGPAVTPAPTDEQLSLIRVELDPNQWYTR